MKKHLLSIILLFTLFTDSISALETLFPGKLTVAVTSICDEEAPKHNCWVNKIIRGLAAKEGLEVHYIQVPFEGSWKLPANSEVDIAATGIAPLPERLQEGVTPTKFYSIVKRGIRIRKKDAHQFSTIDDFIGHSIVVVKGMTAEIDLRNRAPAGVDIIAVDTWDEAYNLFNCCQVVGIAEGFYVAPGQESNEDSSDIMVDAHDLYEGKVEGNTFFVRDASKGLVNILNEYIDELGFPYNPKS